MKAKLTGWVILIVGLALAARTGTNVYRLWKAGNQVIEQKQAVEQAKAENERLKKELARVQDPAVIEKEARDKLGYGRPGETILVIPKETNTQGKVLSAQEKPEANWQRWWKLYIRI